MNIGRIMLVLGAALVASILLANPACAQAAPAASVMAAGDAVIFEGRIDATSTAAVLRLLQTSPITRLIITSGGGDVAAALDMADAIRAHQLDIEVPRACLSSCANYIFPAGRRKTLGRPDAVGWHGNMAHVLHLLRTGQEHLTEGQVDSARQLAARESAFYTGIGVDGFVCWFGKLAPNDVEDFYWLSVADMARFGIRDVTVVTPATVTAPDPQMRELRVDADALETARRAARPSDRPPA